MRVLELFAVGDTEREEQLLSKVQMLPEEAFRLSEKDLLSHFNEDGGGAFGAEDDEGDDDGHRLPHATLSRDKSWSPPRRTLRRATSQTAAMQMQFTEIKEDIDSLKAGIRCEQDMLKLQFRSLKQNLRGELEEIKQAIGLVLNAQRKIISALASAGSSHQDPKIDKKFTELRASGGKADVSTRSRQSFPLQSARKRSISTTRNYSTSPGHQPSPSQQQAIAASMGSRRGRFRSQSSQNRAVGNNSPSLAGIAAAARDLGMNLGPHMTASSPLPSSRISRETERNVFSMDRHPGSGSHI